MFVVGSPYIIICVHNESRNKNPQTTILLTYNFVLYITILLKINNYMIYIYI